MGIFDFVRDAGEKVFDRGGEKRDEETAQQLTRLVISLGFNVQRLNIAYDDGTATISGETASLADREKVRLVVGNTQGVKKVDDRMVVKQPAATVATQPEPETLLYTVKSGDTLGGIAKVHYGNAAKYMTIFEANKPMLKDPNKIYPGQVLRIPPLE